MAIEQSAADRYRPSIQRRDRRWELHAGGRRFAIVFSDHQSTAQVASFQVLRRSGHPRPATPSITKILGLVLGLLGGVATIGIAIQSGRAEAGAASYVVSVPVPERTVQIDIPPRAARKSVAALDVTPAIDAKTAAKPASDPMVVYDDPIPDGVGQLSSRLAATSAAMKTGLLQQWVGAGGEERGFVVAGPDQEGCRDLSILVRRFGADDRVEKSRECLRVASR